MEPLDNSEFIADGPWGEVHEVQSFETQDGEYFLYGFDLFLKWRLLVSMVDDRNEEHSHH